MYVSPRISWKGALSEIPEYHPNYTDLYASVFYRS